jgi:hypothetical protein
MTAQQVAAQVGSGTLPYTRGILAAAQRGNEPAGEGIRVGSQVMVANPEDLNSVDAFAASGVTVSTGVIELVGPLRNPLPRCRNIILENVGGQDVYVSHHPNVEILDSFELSTEGTAGRSTRIELPLLHNVSIYARTVTGSSSVRILIY